MLCYSDVNLFTCSLSYFGKPSRMFELRRSKYSRPSELEMCRSALLAKREQRAVIKIGVDQRGSPATVEISNGAYLGIAGKDRSQLINIVERISVNQRRSGYSYH
jgi:hypothetical protein